MGKGRVGPPLIYQEQNKDNAKRILEIVQK